MVEWSVKSLRWGCEFRSQRNIRGIKWEATEIVAIEKELPKLDSKSTGCSILFSSSNIPALGRQ